MLQVRCADVTPEDSERRVDLGGGDGGGDQVLLDHASCHGADDATEDRPSHGPWRPTYRSHDGARERARRTGFCFVLAAPPRGIRFLALAWLVLAHVALAR